MSIGYVVLHYIFRALTDSCVASIRLHDPAAPLIVVDNGSPEPYENDIPIIRLPENRCLAAAMNAGTDALCRTTEAEILFQLNNDIILTGSTPREIRWAFGTCRQLAIASTMMDQVDADFAYHACPYPPGQAAEQYLAQTLAEHALLKLPFVDNAALAIRREVWEQVGRLEERFSGASWGANYDYCWRARSAGWEVGLVKSAFVFHQHRATWKQLDPDYFEQSVRRMMAEAQTVWGPLARQVLWRDPVWRAQYLGEVQSG